MNGIPLAVSGLILLAAAAAAVGCLYYAHRTRAKIAAIQGTARSDVADLDEGYAKVVGRAVALDEARNGVRVNAVSAGPARTIAARSIPGFASMYDQAGEAAALQRNISNEEVGKLSLYLLSDLSSGVTGQVVYVDAGAYIMAMKPQG